MKSIESLVRKNVLALKPYASARSQYDGIASVYLDANENPYNNGLNRYPDPQQRELKKIIADRNSLSAEQIVLGNGSDELLDIIIRVFCEPSKDNVIITPPTFGIYKVLAATNNVEVREAPLNAKFELNTDDIINLVDDQTKLIFICSPNNPTGNLIDKASIKQLLKLNCIIIIDEAYIDFSEEESWSFSLHQYPNLIVCQTLSKAWGHAGIRVGMCFASIQINSYLNKIRLPYNLNFLSQQKAIEVLSSSNQYKVDVKAIIKEREKLLEALVLLPIVKQVFPSDANFFLVKFTNALEVYNFLVKEGIIIRNFSQAKGCEESMRISVGTPLENQKLISSLQKLT